MRNNITGRLAPNRPGPLKHAVRRRCHGETQDSQSRLCSEITKSLLKSCVKSRNLSQNHEILKSRTLFCQCQTPRQKCCYKCPILDMHVLSSGTYFYSKEHTLNIIYNPTHDKQHEQVQPVTGLSTEKIEPVLIIANIIQNIHKSTTLTCSYNYDKYMQSEAIASYPDITHQSI